ncbi:SLC13 family permease [Tissierella sp. Yu-01]|uniref:GntP family permease n=1 Tax=Tissierella sp. Yu-01 TaxID=3035694 RepID=UPI00240D175F|nr:SLC13 family permease [Tissierella sp. Yu-01]WFA08553.1 SLC13 family permease [Tissierella sp. Yu-01]
MNILLAFMIVMVILFIGLIAFKVSPGVMLFISAILMGLLTQMPIAETLSMTTGGFGNMMSSIGLLIIYGGIFGSMLGDSGGMEELAKGFLRKFGKKYDMLALNLTGFIISIPVYFGSAYITLSPLVESLRKFTKKNTSSYVAALFTGLLLTHCIVAPTPGPLAVAGQLNANIGWFIIYGIVVALVPSLLAGWKYADYLDRFLNKKNLQGDEKVDKKALAETILDSELIKPDPTKPSMSLTIGLIALPIVLIIFNSVFSLVLPEGNIIRAVFGFVGNNNVALFIAMIVSGFVLRKYLVPTHGANLWKYIDAVSDKVGNILMVIGTGGSFAAVLQGSGVGDALVELLTSFNMPLLLLAFLLAMIIRAAVGSATVAMLTTVAIVGQGAVSLGYSPVIIGLAICAGTVGLTLPTDAAFWLPARYNNLTVNEAVVASTIPNTLASIIAFIVILVLQSFVNVLPGMF